MPIVPGHEIVKTAYESGYGVAAINCQGGNYDIVRAVLDTANEEMAPVIVAIHPNNTAYYGLDWGPHLVRHLARDLRIPVAVHLDHGSDVPTVIQAVNAGYSSVMIDYSSKSLSKNIAATRAVLEAARPAGVGVEAELGELRRNEGDTETTPSAKENLVDPAVVKEFIQETRVDMLAIGIGNAHGFYKGEPEIRLDLLAAVRRVAGNTPLVLHGTTGIPEDTVRECISQGMAKVNFGTIVRTQFVRYLRDGMSNEDIHRGHPWRLLQHAHTAIKEDIRRILRLTGSSNRA